MRQANADDDQFSNKANDACLSSIYFGKRLRPTNGLAAMYSALPSPKLTGVQRGRQHGPCLRHFMTHVGTLRFVLRRQLTKALGYLRISAIATTTQPNGMRPRVATDPN